jgi:uncharacterized membrane protein YjgN (DUF898 family)
MAFIPIETATAATLIFLPFLTIPFISIILAIQGMLDIYKYENAYNDTNNSFLFYKISNVLIIVFVIFCVCFVYYRIT